MIQSETRIQERQRFLSVSDMGSNLGASFFWQYKTYPSNTVLSLTLLASVGSSLTFGRTLSSILEFVDMPSLSSTLATDRRSARMSPSKPVIFSRWVRPF
jgi:hypothetical protein